MTPVQTKLGAAKRLYCAARRKLDRIIETPLSMPTLSVYEMEEYKQLLEDKAQRNLEFIQRHENWRASPIPKISIERERDEEL